MSQAEEKTLKSWSGMKSNDWTIFILFMGGIFLISACEAPDKWQLDPLEKLIEVESFNPNIPVESPYIWVDCRPLQNYLDGHIPGAIHIWRDEMSDGHSMILPRTDIERILSQKGVPSDAVLLLYDDHGSCEAARLWWVMDYYGFVDTHILNGGFSAWKSAGLPVVSDITPRDSTRFLFPNLDHCDHSADMKDIMSINDDSKIKIVDTRTIEEFEGKLIKKGASRGGSIPGSIHIDFVDAIATDPADHKKILPVDQLRKIYEQKGLFVDDSIITYCHSGARSAHTTFVLTQLLGYKHVRNYDGSWIEWSFTDP